VSRFPTTLWTMIRQAGDGKHTAVTDLVQRYRPAVVRFARSRGLAEDEAEDVAQEVLLRLFDARLVAEAEEVKGRFRSLVLVITRHVLGHHFERQKAKKRGGDLARIPVDGTGELRLSDLAESEGRDAGFDREWLANLLATALGRLERDNPNYAACLRAFLCDEKSHRQIAADAGKTEGSVRNAISRGRARLIQILRDEVASYSSSEGEFEEELRYLGELIDRSRHGGGGRG
jgi:RNA polymerase sigma factor (sigma-70 family)